MRFTRPTPVAWFFFLAAFGTCLALGTWQVERLEWKRGLIHDIAEANEKTPLTTLPDDPAKLKELTFRRVKLRGTWRHDIEYHIASRYYHGKFGYSLLQPLELADKRIVLVNRGWVPSEKKDIEHRPRSIGAGRGMVDGILRMGNERNFMTPKNQPEKNVWFGRDVEEMAAFYELKNVIPVTVDAVGTQDVKNLPVPSDGTIRLRNDHLSYIVTWYLLALGILTIFTLYHRKK